MPSPQRVIGHCLTQKVLIYPDIAHVKQWDNYSTSTYSNLCYLSFREIHASPIWPSVSLDHAVGTAQVLVSKTRDNANTKSLDEFEGGRLGYAHVFVKRIFRTPYGKQTNFRCLFLKNLNDLFPCTVLTLRKVHIVSHQCVYYLQKYWSRVSEVPRKIFFR